MPTRSKRGTKPEAAAAVRLPPEFEAIVDELGGEPGVTFGGKGFGSSGLKVDGKLFALISSKGLFVAKLPKARALELVRLGQGQPFDPGHGRKMKEWVELESETVPWLDLAREALQFVGGRKR